jgi:hypothetical protein
MAYKHLVPYVNATITQIAGSGFSEDYDQAEGSDTPKWTGTADAWLGEHAEMAEAGEDRSEISHDRLLVAQQDIGSTALALDDSITYTHAGGSPSTRKVRAFEVFDALGLVQVTLRDA